jgi:uridylate kinase
MKKTVVISLGGSLIVPEKINFKFLHKFKKTLRKHYKTHKFVVVCGGGVIARKYISALKKEGKSKKELSQAGIRATRENAQFMIQFFGKEANQTLPKNMAEIKSNLPRNNVVICGALRYDPKATSDSTTAKLAQYFDSDFINMTNVKGLYTSNPKKNPKAKFIPEISWKDFDKIVKKIKFKAGQNFVLDQTASAIISKNKIPTYIIGSNRSLNKILKGKKFVGTLIEG